MKLNVCKLFDAVPARLNVAIMIFTGCWVNYMLRNNLSVNIVAMVPPVIANTTISRSQCKTSEQIQNDTIFEIKATNRSLYKEDAVMKKSLSPPESTEYLGWTTKQQALVLGSYFYGYWVSSFLGGTAAERWGPRYTILISGSLSAILTALSPLSSKHNYITIVVIRAILGLCGGFMYPACHALLARWSPPEEKGKFTSSLMGGVIGTVVTWSVSGPVIQSFGWEWGFYLPAIVSGIWCFFWWYLIADCPIDHPRISDEEKKYILDSIGAKVTKEKMIPPFKSIFTSFSFLSMVILHYGNLWGLNFIMILCPQFISNAVGFNLTASGFLASMPYLARLIFSLIFGAIGDFIQRRQLMPLTAMRKSFTLFSHIIPGLLLVVLTYAGCSKMLAVALITLSMGSNGAAVLTNLANHQDLAPNFAGTLYGIANGIATSSGIAIPLVSAHFISDSSSFDQWRPVLFIGAAVYVAPAIYFVFFGTTETQKWNYKDQTKNKMSDNYSQNNLPEKKLQEIDTKVESTTRC